MTTIKLLPATKRLKQLIQEFGSTWNVIRSGIPVCFHEPGLLIKSTNGQHTRWVKTDQTKGDSK